MSTAYNKYHEGSRIGNWVEETALKELTGTSRYDSWVKEDDMGRTLIITKEMGTDKHTDTTSRVILHSDRVDPCNFESTQHATHNPAKSAYVHESRPALGPRAAAMARMLEREAAAKVDEPEPEPQFETSAQAAFVKYSGDNYSGPKGRRVMRDIDGRELPPGCRDEDFLRANGLSMPTSKMDKADLEAAAADVGKGQAVSIYSQRRGEGAFQGTSAASANPFARSSAFTNDIVDSRQYHATAQDDITRRPRGTKAAATTHVGSFLSQNDALSRLRERLRAKVGVSGLGALGAVLAHYDTSGDGQLSASEFTAALARLKVTVTPREAAELVAYFDVDRSGKITLQELIAGLRGRLSASRSKLVNRAFAAADRGNVGFVGVRDLARIFNARAHPDVQAGRSPEDVADEFINSWNHCDGGRVTAADFADYCTDLSALIADDEMFELVVGNLFGISFGAAAAGSIRVQVTHNDSSQTVVDLANNLGVSARDLPVIRALLRKQGVKNIHSIKVLSS